MMRFTRALGNFPTKCCRKAQLQGISLGNRPNLSTAAQLAPALSAEYYCDKDIYEIERKQLLGPSWQLITHESLLLKESDKAPSTFIADSASGWPCIIVRNSKTGLLSGFHNICRHRAGPLEWDGTSGACKLNGLMCKYHGWTYSLDGKLKGLPRFGDQSSLDKAKYSLWPIRVATWRGLLFAQMLPDKPDECAMSGEEADAKFVEDNKGFCDRLDGVPLENFKFHSSATHPLACNWKVYVENYMEGYHIPTIHLELNKQVDINEYYVKPGPGYVEHIAPPLDGSNTAYEGIWLWFSPTLALNWYGNGLSLERIVPISPTQTEIRYQYLFHADSSETEINHSIDTSREVTQEDVDICEAVQRNLLSGAYQEPGLLSPRHEEGVRYFQNIVRKAHGLASL